MKKIAIIGGSYLQLPLVIKAKEMNIETLCFAWIEGAVCQNYVDHFYSISITEKDEILDICQREKIDAITTIASDLAVLTVTYVAEKMGLIANSDCYARAMTNKFEMRNCFHQYRLPSPLYFKVRADADFSDKILSFPLIVKPTDRSGSLGVEKVDNKNELYIAIERACNSSFSREAIVEEFVDGQEISVESISYEGVHTILQITDKVTTESPFFVELEHHQPSNLSSKNQFRVKEIVLKALDALHIEYGAAHSELKITKEGDIKIIEIGGRMGGDFIGSDLVQLSTGYDFLRGVILCALGDWEKPQIIQSKCSGIFFLCKEAESVKYYIDNASLFPEIIKSEITKKGLRNVQCSGDRSGYFIYQSNKRFNIK